MDINTINSKLAQGDLNDPELFPHLTQLAELPFVFDIDFGLPSLPIEPGILMIRGPRQYGKSTWLEQQLKRTIQEFGAGTAFYLNGDLLASDLELETAISALLTAFHREAPVQRIFIDEITAIERWEHVLKRLADQGHFSKTLVITTGSKATDLRRGAEKLPGRKGKLSRSTYLFTPISFFEFNRVCGETLRSETLLAYLLSGGSPIACTELASRGHLPEYVITLVRDWIEGEIALTGRYRTALMNVFRMLYRFGGTPMGQAKLAREAGLANNTVAAGYIKILSDLCCVIPSYAWDQHRFISILRKPCKYHFTNLLAALTYHPANIRSPAAFRQLPTAEQGIWYEWLIAQELMRRAAICGDVSLTPLNFWQNKNHELDFVVDAEHYIEVKRGKCSAIEFAWFVKQFPGKRLTVINANRFETAQVRGMTLLDYLMNTNEV